MENENSKSKISELVNEIVFGVLFVATLLILIIPFGSVSFALNKGAVGNIPATTLVSFYNVLFGSITIDGTAFNLVNTRIVFIVTLVVLILSVATMFLGWFFAKKNKKLSFSLYGVTFLFVIGVFFALTLSGFYAFSIDSLSTEIYGVDGSSTTTAFGVCAVIAGLGMMFASLSRMFEFKKYTIREMSETAILIALAVVLDKFARIPIQANGGSINFSAIPLLIIAVRYGGFKGFIASSFIFGFITCLIDGYGLQTYPFDYFVALSGYSIVGIFYNAVNNYYAKKKLEFNLSVATKDNVQTFIKDDSNGFEEWKDSETIKKSILVKENIFKVVAIILGGFFAMVVRYCGHMISGAILYQPITFVDNFIYQSTYVPVSVWISVAGMLILYKPIELINRVFPVINKKEEN